MRTCHRALLPATLLLFIALAVLPASAFYNPTTGRWLSRDPLFDLGFEADRPTEDSDSGQDSVSIYASVRNAPINFIDVNGLFSLGDIIGITINPPCGNVSVLGTIALVSSSVTGIGIANKFACNGVRAFLNGQVTAALALLPYAKTFTCIKGSCYTVSSIGPLTLTFVPTAPVTFNVDLTGNLAPPATPRCTVSLKLTGTVTATATIGYCCGK